MTKTGKQHNRAKSAQAMIYLMLVVVILFFVVIWNYDLHKIVSMRTSTQNAGDSAAVMAARWQATTLNLIGDLNIIQAAALAEGDYDTAYGISNIQARLCFTGPMTAFLAAQQAAKQNRTYVNQPFTREIEEHAETVRQDYGEIFSEDGLMLFPEPYEGCWIEYADMLEYIASEGIAVGPENMKRYSDSTGGHILHDIDFYDAIAGSNWCWFYRNAPTLLDDYINFFPCWWSPLPAPSKRYFINCEIYGLGLRKVNSSIAGLIDTNTLIQLGIERGLDMSRFTSTPGNTISWYCYDSSIWTAWDAFNTDGADGFPASGTVYPEYNYSGADASIRLEDSITRLTPSGSRSPETTIYWSSAAKPFGYLKDNITPNAYSLVIPAFRDSRLIPLDTSSAPAGGAFNLSWREHIDSHLPPYMEQGTAALQGGCKYCSQLNRWEDPLFRKAGSGWLELNSDQCIITAGPGGGGGGGGTRRGH